MLMWEDRQDYSAKYGRTLSRLPYAVPRNQARERMRLARELGLLLAAAGLLGLGVVKLAELIRGVL